MTLNLRLVAYNVFGTRIGVLPDSLKFTFTDPYGPDLATLQIEYAKHGRRFATLEARPEVAVEFFNTKTGAWVEPNDARFHVVKRSWNSKDDGAQARTYEAVHIGWLCRKARVWTGDNMNSDGKRQFNAATAGTIIGTLFDDAQGRGWGPGLSRNFDAATDSAGNPWESSVTIAFDPGSDLHTVIEQLANQGLAEVAWSGRVLNLFNPREVGSPFNDTTRPWIRYNDGVTSAPEQGSIEDLMTAARLVGDGGAAWDVTNPEASPTYGRLEAYITQSGVTDEGTANLLIQQELEAGARERVQYTREWDAAVSRVLPWQQYRPGDWIWVDREDGGDAITRELSRVVQVSVTVDESGVSGHTTLGTRLDDLLDRLARRTAAATGQASRIGGGGGTPGTDVREPAKVLGLVASTDSYLDGNGEPRARVALDWANVTTDAFGVLLTIRGYEIWLDGGGGPDTLVTTVVNSDVALSPLPPATTLTYKVRAVSQAYVTGPFSDPVTITTASDTTPPPVPSAPILTTRLGSVTVTWDGKNESGGGMPADFSHVQVWMGASYPGTYVGRLGGRLDPATLSVMRDLPTPPTEATFRLVAVDTSGNESDPSDPTGIEVAQVTGADIQAASIETEHLSAGALDGVVITGTTIQTAEQGQRVVLSDVGLIAFDNDDNPLTYISADGRLHAVDAELTGTLEAGDPLGAQVTVGGVDPDGGVGATWGGITLRRGGSVSGTITTRSEYAVNVTGEQYAFFGVEMNNTGLGIQGPVGDSYLTAVRHNSIVAGNDIVLSAGASSFVHVQAGTFYVKNGMFYVNGANVVAQNLIATGGGAIIQTSGQVSIMPGGHFVCDPVLGAYIRPRLPFFLQVNGYNSLVADTNGTVRISYQDTTANINARLQPNGTILRVQSRRDSKLLVEPIPTERLANLLDLPVVTWFDRAAAEAMAEALDGDGDVSNVHTTLTRIPGLVAEDVEATGLTEFVEYDDDGRIASVAYDRVGVAWIPLVRDLFDRIRTLEERTAP